MRSNKDRLYVALYVRGGAPKMPGGEDKYHWALLLGPKNEGEVVQGKRYHATNGPSAMSQGVTWSFEERETSMLKTNALLVRILVAKVKDTALAASTLRSVPIPHNESAWNCVLWVRDALKLLDLTKGALGTRQLDWTKLKATALRYCEDKKAMHRFDGKAEPGMFSHDKAATYDLLKERETIP